MFKPDKINIYLQELLTNYDENIILKLKSCKVKSVDSNIESLDNPYVLWFLHRCYYKGLGVSEDIQLAFNYLQLANSKINNLYFKYDLGVLYEHGMGCEINNELAFKYYNEAFDMCNNNCLYLPVIYFKLGYFYCNGLGVNKDINKAIEYYKLSCDLNNHKACYYLGLMYYLGTEVKMDLNLAFKLFEKSVLISKYTFHRAIYKLGYCYELGIGTKINYEKAKDVYKQGLRLNCIQCIYSYTNLYIDKKLKFKI
jgi:TPR repeat protein